eukprot:6051010-Pleurochrysis_carterae.AAC.1
MAFHVDAVCFCRLGFSREKLYRLYMTSLSARQFRAIDNHVAEMEALIRGDEIFRLGVVRRFETRSRVGQGCCGAV